LKDDYNKISENLHDQVKKLKIQISDELLVKNDIDDLNLQTKDWNIVSLKTNDILPQTKDWNLVSQKNQCEILLN